MLGNHVGKGNTNWCHSKNRWNDDSNLRSQQKDYGLIKKFAGMCNNVWKSSSLHWAFTKATLCSL
jgi:hypothetical protein